LRDVVAAREQRRLAHDDARHVGDEAPRVQPIPNPSLDRVRAPREIERCTRDGRGREARAARRLVREVDRDAAAQREADHRDAIDAVGRR
jgi:hypothetical protein